MVEAGEVSSGEDEYISPAQRRLDNLRAAKSPRAELVTIDGTGESYWIKIGGFADRITFEALKSRNKAGVLDVDEAVASAAVGFIAAALKVYVVSGEFNETPFFTSFADAFLFADARDAQAQEVAETLLDKIIAMNPRLNPEYVKPTPEELKAAREAEKKSESGGEANELSLTPPTIAPPNGSSETPSIDAPAIWQSDVGYSTDTSKATPQPSNA